MSDHSDDLFSLLGEAFTASPPCYFCSDPGPCRFLYWTMKLLFDGTTTPAQFYHQCSACAARPKHVLDAIIANGGKMPD